VPVEVRGKVLFYIHDVSYQINCYTKHPEQMMRVYSTLHQNIQDQFTLAGVEIISPVYTASRDGNTATIPLENRPEGYEAEGFRISNNP
jgi:hypothetical protein